ncbi:MAG: tyrosine--tRNA ligase [Acidimicrobiales bacterium]
MDLLADLDARGLIQDSTDRHALAEALAWGQVTLYHGVDPTADSLHTGNLIGLVMLRRFLDAGHHPIALAGGATGMIGDPGGRSSERNLLDEATLEGNVAAISAEINRVLGPGGWTLVNNADWTRDVRLLDFLRDVGKHATVNQMVARESVKQRMAGQDGISFTEFSYMLLQAFDYQHLYDEQGCTLQIGGSDQWGNILSGVELIRRTRGASVHALSWPLLTAADGSKLGKSTGARVWLDPAKTSPYELFQHWLRTDDADVDRLLRWFTLLDVGAIDELVATHARDPGRRLAQRALAEHVTALVHGADEAARAAAASTTAFAPVLDAESLRALEGELPTTWLPDDAPDRKLTALLAEVGLARSRTAATKLIEQRGAYLNDEVVTDPDTVVGRSARREGRWVLLRAGKKQRHLLVYEPPVES